MGSSLPRDVWTGKIIDDYDYSYIVGDYDLPDGWNKLFLQMCEDIRQPLIDVNYLNNFRFAQVKEKYNTLRAYTFGAPHEVHDIIDKYEYISRFVCQKCGKPATIETKGWIASYCDECYNNFTNTVDAPDETEPIKFDSNKYADIWDRLYSQEGAIK